MKASDSTETSQIPGSQSLSFGGPAKSILYKQAPLQELHPSSFASKGLRLFILRGDLIHPVISGNKLWKLRYNLEEALRLQKTTLLTFGGAYSNHLPAVAFAAQELGLKSIGIVRGDEFLDSPVLQTCRSFGMDLKQVSRAEYRNKLQIVMDHYPNFPGLYVLPEGGSNALAVKGCAEIVPRGEPFEHLFVAVGTGGTLAGLARGAQDKMPGCRVQGVAVLKGADYLRQEVETLAPGLANWALHLDFHQGGYARVPATLKIFVEKFRTQTGIALDPVYSGKMMSALFELAAKDHFKAGSKILCIHTGGNLQNQSAPAC